MCRMSVVVANASVKASMQFDDFPGSSTLMETTDILSDDC